MILLDYSGVAFPSAMATCPPGRSEFDIDLVRHSILNSIRSANRLFKDYGDLIVCCDGPRSWRKQFYPNYKSKRVKNDSIKLYWDGINQIKKEVRENFPYQTIEVEGAEGDDVIAILAKNSVGPDIVISNDKDMVQLMTIPGIKVYSPSKESFITPTRSYVKNKIKIVEDISPELFLTQHILKGDSGDSVPNIKSDDNVFIEKRTQKDISRDYIDNFKIENLEEEFKMNYLRNETLISLDKIPDNIKTLIINEYSKSFVSDKTKLFDYFVSNNLKELMSKISDF